MLNVQKNQTKIISYVLFLLVDDVFLVAFRDGKIAACNVLLFIKKLPSALNNDNVYFYSKSTELIGASDDSPNFVQKRRKIISLN